MPKKQEEKEAKEEQTIIEKVKAKARKSKGPTKSSLEKDLNDLQQEHGELKDKYLRLMAEFENFRKRSIRENLERMKTASQDVMTVLLSVLDDFDRAKKSADDDDSSENFSEGVTLVYNKLNSVLQLKGLEKIPSTGELFDPEIHEAITEIPVTDDAQKGKVVDTVEQGYLLNDKIIRHAKVVVGK